MPKGRTLFPLDISLLKQAITTAEQEGPLPNLSRLYETVRSILVNELGVDHNLTPSVVMLRIRDEKIPVKTQKGRIGRQKGWKKNLVDKNGNAPIIKRSRKIKPENIQAVAKHVGPKYINLVNRIARGSLTAMIKLNCLECSGFQREEVKYCGCVQCPFWSVRPFQKSLNENLEEEEASP